MRGFSVLWAGQLVSMVGSGLTGFALPVWFYQRTGSAEQFAFLIFAGTVPALLLSPFAGALVDRWDRRTVLVLSDAGTALMTLVMAGLFFTDSFQVWHLFVVSVLGSAIGAFQDPAFHASVAQLLPQRHFARASAMMQTSAAASGVLAPAMAGALVTTIGLGGVLMIDFATFLVAVGTLAAVRIPRSPRGGEDEPHAEPSLLREAAHGWRYVAARPGLKGLLLYAVAVAFVMSTTNVVLQPMVLSLASVGALGLVSSLSAVGMVLGGTVVTVWGGPKRRVRGLAASNLARAAALVVAGATASVPVIAAALFVIMLLLPISSAAAESLWMSKTPNHLQGRVFAIRRMITLAGTPLGILLAGPLAERVFEPLLAPGGALAGSWGRVIGVGEGRGMGMMLILLGTLFAAATLAMYLSPRVRRVEDELPDAAFAPEPEPELPPAPPAPVVV
jgi:MFS family permease